MIKVVVVDDDPCVRQGLRMRLGIETDLQVIGEGVEWRGVASADRSIAA